MKKLFTLIIAFCLLVGIGCSGSYNEEQINNVRQVSPNICMAMTVPGKSHAADNIRSKIISLMEQQDRDVPLDVCVYGLDDEQIILALENVIADGVHIRFVGNADGSRKLSDSSGYYYDGYRRIAAALDKHSPSDKGLRVQWTKHSKFNDFRLVNGSGIMHNKFMIFTDKNGQKTLMTGSMNLTQSCIELNNNDILFISDNRLADKYVRQFNYLLGLHSQPECFERFVIDGNIIEVGFSHPSSKSSYVTDRIVSSISECESTIDFMIFTMTSQTLFDKIINKMDNGISVRGIFDKAQLRSSKEEYLLGTSAECRSDGNEYIMDNHGGKLHHKCMIIDAAGDNPIVVTGSFNWTLNADKQNNENILIIHNDNAAKIYSEFFEMNWSNGKSF